MQISDQKTIVFLSTYEWKLKPSFCRNKIGVNEKLSVAKFKLKKKNNCNILQKYVYFCKNMYIFSSYFSFLAT